MSTPEVTTESEQPNTKGRRFLPTLPFFQKSELDYSKLYEQEQRSTRELSGRLEDVYRRILDAAHRSRSRQLNQALSQEHGQEDAQRAVHALIIEYENSLKERRVLEGLVEKNERKVIDTEDDLDKEKRRRVADVSRLEGEQRQLIADYEKHIDRAETERKIERERMEKKFITEKEQMQVEFHTTKLQMERDFKDAKSQMESDHAEQQDRLKSHIESLNGALVAREHFKPLSDHDLKSLFSDLVDDIDYLARLEWKQNQTDWTKELLGQVSKNQRKLKKHLLQESMWIALYENIFCSPFRVFGEQGRSLETQWTGAFGQDLSQEKGFYTWPKPSLDAERWRYETIKQCQEALEQPTSEWDPRDKLKKGFESSLRIIKAELSKAIEKVSDVDNSTDQALEVVTRKAAKMWLEFGTQRCRILVVMSPSNLSPPSDKIRKVRESFLELVVVPELRRLGNSKGQDLDRQERVAGCEGLTDRVSMSDF